MRVKVGVGLDDLVFGMSQEMASHIMGQPDKVIVDEPLRDIAYWFNRKQIQLIFDQSEDYRLYSMVIFNPSVELFDQRVIGRTKSEILDFLRVNGCSCFRYEDYDLFETVHCEELWSEFTFQFGRLRSLTISPLFDDDENIVWPVLGDLGRSLDNGFDCLDVCNVADETPWEGVSMEVSLGRGVGDIVFGMLREDVIQIMGEPDKVLDSDDDVVIYSYDEQMLLVKFDMEEAGRLYSLDVYNPQVILFGSKIIGVGKSDVLALLDVNGYSDFVLDDYEYFDTVYCRDMRSTLRFRFDALTDIEFSPLSNSDHEPIWPLLMNSTPCHGDTYDPHRFPS